MEEFKEFFTKMATEYVKYVAGKIEAYNQNGNVGQNGETIYPGSTEHVAYAMMNEVRAANVVAASLHRLNRNEEYHLFHEC